MPLYLRNTGLTLSTKLINLIYYGPGPKVTGKRIQIMGNVGKHRNVSKEIKSRKLGICPLQLAV